MHCSGFAATVALVWAPCSLGAQEAWPPPQAATLRTVISFEVSASLVTSRSQSEWTTALPEPLIERLTNDESFAALDLGGPAGNGVSVRFHFADMESYRLWNDRPDIQQLLAELRQAIGYGYSRTSLSMRRVAGDPHATTPRRGHDRTPAPRAPVTTQRTATRTP